MLHKIVLASGLLSMSFVASAQHHSGQFISLLSEEVVLHHASYSTQQDGKPTAAVMPVAALNQKKLQLPATLVQQVARWKKEPFGRHSSIVTGWYSNGQKAVTVTLRQQQMNGNWQTWYSNGQHRDSGRLINNLPDGVWKLWHPNGQLRSIRHYNAQKYEMMQVALRQQNPKLTFHPLAMQSHKQPEVFQRHTRTSAVLPVMVGETTAPELPFAAGLPHGVVADYNQQGASLIAGHYHQGLKEGFWQYYNEDGLMASGYYWQGQRHGAWKIFGHGGKMRMMQEYQHGKLVFSKKYK